jgi:hypothetical protein
MIDVRALLRAKAETTRYRAQLERLHLQKIDTDCIEKAVDGASLNLQGQSRSFVIFGEPQSGKTEMMICLTGRLLDEGHRIIVHLLNDSVQLLEQNLDRFKRAALAPTARNFTEILASEISLKIGEHIIFAKKNAKDLEKLLDLTKKIPGKIIIDDEADFATPNAKINQGEVTRINKLIGDLIGDDGAYIGVTATPARLDLNNTFENDNESWVHFPSHKLYTGQEQFFPIDGKVSFRLKLLGDESDDPKFAREALFRFMVSVAYLNLFANDKEINYAMLIHTSGKRDDHRIDRRTIESVFETLQDETSDKRIKYFERLADIANELYPNADTETLLRYILDRASRFHIVVMNSDRDKGTDFSSATNPASLFTIVVGGNIVSRGVTFNNLLSMYFTRNTKTKLQQDTYIQRARMFGNRGKYLQHFELTIPASLYQDWHRCFVFHKLALHAITEGRGSPIWLADNRISAVAGSSIDRARVQFDRGEMSFARFRFQPSHDSLADDSKHETLDRLRSLQDEIGDAALPAYLLQYVSRTSPDGSLSVAFHRSRSIAEYGDADQDAIQRTKGFMGKSDLEESRFPKAIHHFKIFRNAAGMARVLYKFQGSIQFLKNLNHGG